MDEIRDMELKKRIKDNKIWLTVLNCIIEFETEKRKNTLVGRFAEARPNMDIIRQWMYEKWKITRQVDLIPLRLDFLMFKFYNEEDMENVLDLGPQFLGRKVRVLQRWNPDFIPDKKNFQLVLVCIFFPKLPTPFFNINVLKALANGLGKLFTLDKITLSEGRMDGARFCIYLDISKPLKDNIFIAIELDTWE